MGIPLKDTFGKREDEDTTKALFFYRWAFRSDPCLAWIGSHLCIHTIGLLKFR